MKNSFLVVLLLCVFTSIKATPVSFHQQKDYNIKDYGAVGDGRTDDAKAIDACNAAGGGQVVIPSGFMFLSGPFNLKSNIEFYVEVNARILANPDEKVYVKSAFRENKGEGTIWIGGENLENVTICGGGIIDGNGTSFMGKELADSYELKPFNIIDSRPHLLTIVGGKNIRIKDFTIKNFGLLDGAFNWLQRCGD
ncbi:MAG: glycosyl hydrolase family 28 protein [Janthinobacterium lividum]